MNSKMNSKTVFRTLRIMSWRNMWNQFTIDNSTGVINRPYTKPTVNQQILAAIKFGVSQNKVIWRLLNLASPRGPSMQCTIDVYVGGDKY